jgi:hypothetical protein
LQLQPMAVIRVNFRTSGRTMTLSEGTWSDTCAPTCIFTVRNTGQASRESSSCERRKSSFEVADIERDKVRKDEVASRW